MVYKPKFCCNCGEKIERRDWKLLTSRRFCELCETDFKLGDWMPRGVVLIGVLAGVFGLGSFLQKSEKPLNLARNVHGANSFAPPIPDVAAAIDASNSAKQDKDDISKEFSAPDQKTLPVQLEGQQNRATEIVYFCGAKTKKGKPCTRLVKGGGRCWQHPGRPAMLPEEKLRAAK